MQPPPTTFWLLFDSAQNSFNTNENTVIS